MKYIIDKDILTTEFMTLPVIFSFKGMLMTKKMTKTLHNLSTYLIDFSVFLCYTFQDHKELEAMAQTTAEFLIEQGKDAAPSSA